MDQLIESHLGKVDRTGSKLPEGAYAAIDEALDEMGLRSLYYLDEISGKKLHPFMIPYFAYTDGELLIFFNVSHENRNKFLYYMGAENEAELVSLWKGVAIYKGVSESRLTQYEEKESESS